MSDKNTNTNTDCPGFILIQNTNEDIGKIREAVQKVSTCATVNASNLHSMAGTMKEIAKENTRTHADLYDRSEKTQLDVNRVETMHEEHIKNESKEDNNTHHRYSSRLSLIAIGLTVVTIIVLIATMMYS